MALKIFIFFVLILSIKLPITNIIDFSLVSFIILLLISSKEKEGQVKNLKQSKYYVFILTILTILNFSIPKLNIQESHSVFLNHNDIKKISEILPKNIINKIYTDYNNFDYERFSKAGDSAIHLDKNTFESKEFITSPYSFSSDSVWQNQKYTRITNQINFSSREKLRIGLINSINYNFIFDKELRRILPYYVLFEIPKLAQGSKICTEGNVFYYLSNDELNTDNIQDVHFNKMTSKCMIFEKSFKILYLIGYSINRDDNLTIELKENFFLKMINFISFSLILSIIFMLFRLFFQFKITDLSKVYIVSFFSLILICFIKDINVLTGLRYFRGGADGLLHFSFGRDILENFINQNYYLAFKGGESVFYFMPGQRYLVALSNSFFGDTSYGYILLMSLLPMIFYIFFKKYLDKKYAIILLISFIFLPIFENMGFGYFNYIWSATRNLSEALSIFLIILSLMIILELNEFKSIDKKITLFFCIGFFLAIAAILRPNFFFSTSIITLFISVKLFNDKKYLTILFFLLGYSFFLVCLLHNIYFANDYNLFSNAFNNQNYPINPAVLLSAVISFITLNFENENFLNLIHHILWWNPLYNFHRILILIYIAYSFIRFKQIFFNYMILTCLMFQHAFLFVSIPSSRYAYLAWLLTLILFLKLIYDQKIFVKLYTILKFKSLR